MIWITTILLLAVCSLLALLYRRIEAWRQERSVLQEQILALSVQIAKFGADPVTRRRSPVVEAGRSWVQYRHISARLGGKRVTIGRD